MATQAKTGKMLNGINVDALFATIHSIRRSPETARFKFRVRNQWITGGRNRSLVTEFQSGGKAVAHSQAHALETDEPPILQGEDKAPNPAEYLLHALAACVTSSMMYHAAGRGIQIDEVESEIEGDIDLRGFLGIDESIPKGYQDIRMTVRIKADVPEEQVQEVCQLGVRFSPVFNTLAKSITIKVNAERG